MSTLTAVFFSSMFQERVMGNILSPPYKLCWNANAIPYREAETKRKDNKCSAEV